MGNTLFIVMPMAWLVYNADRKAYHTTVMKPTYKSFSQK